MTTDLIEKIETAILSWISDSSNSGLDEAVKKTTDHGLFSLNDIEHSLSQINQQIGSNGLRYWRQRVCESSRTSGETQTILCLHAGNLPMVGFQDAMAVLVSGNKYAGKLSRKDPFLISSCLEFISTTIPELKSEMLFSTDIDYFRNLKADKWMFAGSESSLSDVYQKLISIKAIQDGAESLLRVAHFSVAIIEKCCADEVLQDLVESILRYDGKGCRSVAIVYSDNKLSEVKSKLYSLGLKWLSDAGKVLNQSDLLRLKYAYNCAVGIEQVWVGNALIQEGIPVIGHPQHVFWQQLDEYNNQMMSFGSGIQQIYVSSDRIRSDLELNSSKLDYLSNSQRPNLYWTPDGIDPLKWILKS